MNKESGKKYVLQREGVSEQIFHVLKEKITSKEWKPGMKISSENELAAQFGVSRMSARNALQRLCALGLLETRVGEGTFVKEFSLADYFKEAAGLIGKEKTINEIREFRIPFETDYLRLACERRTQEDIDDLKAIHHRMEELSEGTDFDAYFNADTEFHHRICEMTRNQVYIMISAAIWELLAAQLKDNTRFYSRYKDGVSENKADDNYILKKLTKDHEQFIEALEKRDYMIAAEDFLYHISEYKDMQE